MSLNAIVPEPFAIETAVIRPPLAPTAPLKVIPPELVMVKVPISVPIAPETVIADVVLKVIFDLALPAVPEIELNVIGVAAPAPRTKVAPSSRVTAPRVIRPEVGLRVVLYPKRVGTLM